MVKNKENAEHGRLNEKKKKWLYEERRKKIKTGRKR